MSVFGRATSTLWAQRVTPLGEHNVGTHTLTCPLAIAAEEMMKDISNRLAPTDNKL